MNSSVSGRFSLCREENPVKGEGDRLIFFWGARWHLIGRKIVFWGVAVCSPVGPRRFIGGFASPHSVFLVCNCLFPATAVVVLDTVLGFARRGGGCLLN